MANRLVNSQLTNMKTYDMYRRQLLTLAENVFEFENMPKFIFTPYLNKTLLRKGAIAFFWDEVMGLLALPFTNIGNLDVYGRPTGIKVMSRNGYTKTLHAGEFVIMYDNNGQYPLYLDVLQYAERLALDTRTGDINMNQMKTPRFWKTTTEKEKTVKDLVTNIDAFSEIVITYDNIDLEDTQLILQPAPFIANEIDTHKEKIWNEFLRLIGISNLSVQKKERNIRDEITAMQGGTIASRYSRFEPRQKAVELINEKWGDRLGAEIKVKYYDGLPNSQKELEDFDIDENFDESEDEENDI